jgi:hypothetical protein
LFQPNFPRFHNDLHSNEAKRQVGPDVRNFPSLKSPSISTSDDNDEPKSRFERYFKRQETRVDIFRSTFELFTVIILGLCGLSLRAMKTVKKVFLQLVKGMLVVVVIVRLS